MILSIPELNTHSILSYDEIKMIIKTIIQYANGKININIICQDIDIVNDNKIDFMASSILNRIVFNMYMIRQSIFSHQTLKNNIPKQRGYIIHLVLHELSHLDQYVSITNSYTETERVNDYHTDWFLYHNYNDIYPLFTKDISLFYASTDMKDIDKLNNQYIRMTDNDLFNLADGLIMNKYKVSLKTFINSDTSLLDSIDTAYKILNIGKRT